MQLYIIIIIILYFQQYIELHKICQPKLKLKYHTIRIKISINNVIASITFANVVDWIIIIIIFFINIIIIIRVWISKQNNHEKKTV